ncbi:MAG: hypothetical protein ACE5R6_15120 [Candidatus Heimdallarchaeota archaeon]
MVLKTKDYLDDVYPKDPTYFERILRKYIHQKRLPFVIVRVLAELTQNRRKALATWLSYTSWESFKHITFRMPIHLSPKLAYFLGVCAGDGSLTRTHISIIDNYPAFIRKLLELTTTLFGGRPKIVRGSRGVYILFIKSVWAGRLLNLLTDQPYGKKYHVLRCPLILKNSKLERFYWRGLFDTDGSYSQTMQFGTVSDQLIRDFEYFLEQHELNYYTHFYKKGNTIQLKIGSYKVFSQLVGSWHPNKQQQCLNLLRQGTKVTVFKGVKSSSLTEKGYLNLALLPKLHVIIKDQRIRVLHLLTMFGDDAYPYLITHHAKFVYPHASYPIHLPLKPTKQVLILLKYLSPTKNGIAVTTGKHRGHYRDLEQTVEKVHQLFGFQSLTRTNGGYDTKHKLLRDYLRTYFVYESAWLPLTRKEEINLLEDWNSFLPKNFE